jgi:hypothetical protein
MLIGDKREEARERAPGQRPVSTVVRRRVARLDEVGDAEIAPVPRRSDVEGREVFVEL